MTMPDQSCAKDHGVTYTITQLAEEFGATPRAIRFYEDKGLLSPERQGQTRIYHYRDRARLILILRGKRVGLTLAEIREILDMYDAQGGEIEQYRFSIQKFRERIAKLEEQREDIDQSINELRTACERLEKYLAENSPAPQKSAPAAATASAAAE